MQLCGASSRISPVSRVPASFPRPDHSQLLRVQGMRFVLRSDQGRWQALSRVQATVHRISRQILPAQGAGSARVLLQEGRGMSVGGRTERPRQSLTERLQPFRARVSVQMRCTPPATFPPRPRDGRLSTASARDHHTEPTAKNGRGISAASARGHHTQPNTKYGREDRQT